ncbi:MAG: FecCD family ABC transporter permease [Bacillus sp. (in: firmicutes)]
MSMTKLSPNRNNITKHNIFLGISLAMILFLFVASLMYGTKHYTLDTAIQALFTFDESQASHAIIRDIRLPRAVAAALVGAFLALSGCIMQVLTRNPIAEPALLGVSHGASFALVLVLSIYPTMSNAGTALASIIGAGVAVAFVFSLAAFSKGGQNSVKLALAGVALGMFLSSLTTAIGLYANVAKDMSFWYAGGLSSIEWSSVKILMAGGVFGLAAVLVIAKPLTVLFLGEDVSRGLGIRIQAVRVIGIIAVLLLTGTSVAVSGAIGFIGLVVPHISRMLIGTDLRYWLPLSALLGSSLLMMADMAAKLVNPPYETPVGTITAIIGVPFFLYLVRRRKGVSFR